MLLEEAVSIRRYAQRPEHPALAQSLLSLGQAQLASGEASRAVPALEEARRIYAQVSIDPDQQALAGFALARAWADASADVSKIQSVVRQAESSYQAGAAPRPGDLDSLRQWAKQSGHLSDRPVGPQARRLMMP